MPDELTLEEKRARQYAQTHGVSLPIARQFAPAYFAAKAAMEESATAARQAQIVLEGEQAEADGDAAAAAGGEP